MSVCMNLSTIISLTSSFVPDLCSLFFYVDFSPAELLTWEDLKALLVRGFSPFLSAVGSVSQSKPERKQSQGWRACNRASFRPHPPSPQHLPDTEEDPKTPLKTRDSLSFPNETQMCLLCQLFHSFSRKPFPSSRLRASDEQTHCATPLLHRQREGRAAGHKGKAGAL